MDTGIILNDTYLGVPTTKGKESICILGDVMYLPRKTNPNSLWNLLLRKFTQKKTILTTAFRGGLGTGDENDESAVQLLRDTLESH